MNKERHQQIESLFHRLSSVNDTSARKQALHSLAGDDPELRRVLEDLLNSFDAWSSGAPQRTPAPLRCGPYLCEELIGSGGMGSVYRAIRVDGQFDQEVAIKLLRGSLRNDVYRARFLAERQILARLNHPHIARLLDGGVTDEGEPYLVMEFVRGEPLDAYCDSRRLGVRPRLELFQQVLDAVESAHRNLVVHRDLKPSNILVTTSSAEHHADVAGRRSNRRNPAEGSVKLLDFGTSKLLETDGVTTELAALTPSYASPEQLRGDPIATTSDVFSLGVVLFQLLTGRLPFGEGKSHAGNLERALRPATPARPETVVDATAAERRGSTASDLRKQLRGDLASILAKALADDAGQRYSSVQSLADDVRRYLDGRPVSARRQGWTYILSRAVRRHRQPLAASLAALILLGWAGVYAWRQQTEAALRFEDSRRIAKYLLFELFDDISRLPGSTGVRAQMAARAQLQLDRLSAVSGSNREILIETAAGYNRLAEAYGVPGSPNLGDSAAAAQSLRKAHALLEHILRATPRDQQASLELARNHALAAKIAMWSHGNTAAAEQSIGRAERHLDTARDPTDVEWLRLRSVIRVLRGDLYDFQQKWVDEAREAQKGLAEIDLWPNALRETELFPLHRALLLRQAGNAMYYQGGPIAALAKYQEAEALLAGANGRWPNRPAIMTVLMQAGYDSGTTLDALRRPAESIAAIRRALSIGEKLMAIEDRDQALLRNYLIVRQASAQLLAESGRFEEGLREQIEVVKARERRAAEQPALPGPARDYAFALFVLGQVYETDRGVRRRASLQRACEIWQDALRRFEALRKSNAITDWDWDKNAVPLRQALQRCGARVKR